LGQDKKGEVYGPQANQNPQKLLMNRHVNAIAGRLSLRPPQRRSLEILDRITEIVPAKKDTDVAAALAAIRSEFPTVTDFEREFPSVCFALATGVGKTRLMGAFISYLHLAHGINNFFVLAPNLTIYNKLVTDFTPNTPKYVFTGIAEFAVNAPAIVTGDNYEQRDPLSGVLFGGVRINIFNISKINSEVRGGKAPRIKRLSEYIGESYFEYLANLKDLVLIMDESHRYRASAGVRAINELKPVLGLELTATPYVESKGTQVEFRNIIYHYRLANAMADGFVKEPAVVTRKNFNPTGMAAEEIERLKLEDGVRLHETTLSGEAPQKVSFVIPQAVLDKRTTAQRSGESPPPYEVLDPILEAFIEKDYSVDQIEALGFDRATVGKVLGLVKRAEYKRRQAPPGVRVSSRAFGRDWRYPITSGY
jgi:type III restriction enzyme